VILTFVRYPRLRFGLSPHMTMLSNCRRPAAGWLLLRSKGPALRMPERLDAAESEGESLRPNLADSCAMSSLMMALLQNPKMFCAL